MNNIASEDRSRCPLIITQCCSYVTCTIADICYFADDVAEFGWGEAIETLTVSNNANTAHLYSSRREQYALFFWRKETLWAGFFSKEYDCVEFRR